MGTTGWTPLSTLRSKVKVKWNFMVTSRGVKRFIKYMSGRGGWCRVKEAEEKIEGESTTATLTSQNSILTPSHPLILPKAEMAFHDDIFVMEIWPISRENGRNRYGYAPGYSEQNWRGSHSIHQLIFLFSCSVLLLFCDNKVTFGIV